MALKYGYSRTRTSSGTTYTDRSGKKVSAAEAESSGGRKISRTSRNIQQSQRATTLKQEYLSKGLTEQEATRLANAQARYETTGDSAARTNYNIARSQTLTRLKKEQEAQAIREETTGQPQATSSKKFYSSDPLVRSTEVYAEAVEKREKRLRTQEDEFFRSKGYGFIDYSGLRKQTGDSGVTRFFKATGRSAALLTNPVGWSLISQNVVMAADKAALYSYSSGVGLYSKIRGSNTLSQNVKSGQKEALKTTGKYFLSPEGASSVFVASGFAGLKTGQALKTRNIVSPIKSTTVAKGRVTTKGGTFNVRQNVPQKLNTQQIITFKEARAGPFGPKTSVKLNINKGVVTESRTLLGRTYTRTSPISKVKLGKVEAATLLKEQTTRTTKYNEPKTEVRQSVRVGQEYKGSTRVGNYKASSDIKTTSITKQTDVGGLYRTYTQKGQGVEFRTATQAKATSLGNQFKLKEIGQSRVQVTKSPEIFRERVTTTLTGKDVGTVTGLKTIKSPQTTTRTYYQATEATLTKTPKLTQLKSLAGSFARSEKGSFTGLSAFSRQSSQLVKPQSVTFLSSSEVFPQTLFYPDTSTIGSAPSLISAQSTLISPSTITKPRTSTIPRIDTKPITDVKPIIDIKPIQDITPIQEITPTQQTRPRQKTRQSQTQRPRQVTLTKPVLTQTPQTPQPRPLPPPRTVTPRSTFTIPLPFQTDFFKKPKARGEKGFNVFVKEKGQFVKVSDFALSREQAIRRGAFYTDRTSAATFKIVPSLDIARSTNKDLFKGSLTQFRSPKRKKKLLFTPNLFVEKSKYRINTAGEKRQITVKGLRARRKRLL